eukprot:340636_1
MTTPLIYRIDAIIAGYYKSCNRDYNKVFATFCQENGFDDEEIHTECNLNSQDNILVDFDETFPLPPNERKPKQFIHNFLKRSLDDAVSVSHSYLSQDIFMILAHLSNTFNENVVSVFKKVLQEEKIDSVDIIKNNINNNKLESNIVKNISKTLNWNQKQQSKFLVSLCNILGLTSVPQRQQIVVDLKWCYIESALKHELYDEISSALMIIVNRKKLRDKDIWNNTIIKQLLDELKVDRKIQLSEINYIEQLVNGI